MLDSATHIALCTFDLDLLQYGKAFSKEFEKFYPIYCDWKKEFPQLKSTWFLRIDRRTHHLYGQWDYSFEKYKREWEILQNLGDELQWHFHPFVLENNKWIQNKDAESIVKEMQECASFIAKHHISALRMGWGFHTSQTLQKAKELGIQIDSSALPQINNSEWVPRKSEVQNLDNKMLELPITDYRFTNEQETIWGILGLGLPNDLFAKILQTQTGNYLNLVTHPFEILPIKTKKSRYHHNPEKAKKNLQFLIDNAYQFKTISEMA